ncbi:MAG: hypothetical protein LBG12_06710, partial [Synergistaceae bacterium]|nr:hypothetical protein [Synergistaceae bacterium]
MAAELRRMWREEYTAALKATFEAIPDEFTEKAAKFLEKKLLDALGEPFGASKTVRELLHEYISESYINGKKEFVVKPLTSLPDRRAIEALTKHNCFWLGQHYGEHIGPKISELTRSALDTGIGRKALAEDLKKELGGVAPKDYKYWDVVSSAALVRGRSFGFISGMREAKLEYYEVLAMMDERTCPICRTMNGRVFSVAAAKSKINEVIEIKDPDKFKAALPWQNKPSLGIKSETLMSEGKAIPPFHGRCRCTLIAAEGPEEEEEAFEPEAKEKYNNTLDPVDMPVQRGKPIGIDQAKEGTNPNFSKGFEYEYNCQRCVPAYELRRRGYDVESMPIDLKKVKGKNLDSLAVAPQSIFVDKDGVVLKPNRLFTTAVGQELKNKLKDELLKTDGDARFEIQVLWDRRRGHVFVAEKQGDDIV